MSARTIIREMFLAVERDAINSYARWTGTAWVFNDTAWRAEDNNFPMFRRARIFLGLKPLKYRGASYPAGVDRALSTSKGEGEGE